MRRRSKDWLGEVEVVVKGAGFSPTLKQGLTRAHLGSLCVILTDWTGKQGCADTADGGVLFS